VLEDDMSGYRRKLSGGFRLTTNNRMELMACIAGLRALKPGCRVTLHSDSRYVVRGVTRGWARRWRANDWQRRKGVRAENADLWAQLLDLLDLHAVEVRWVRGHAGVQGNERADQLARAAAQQKDLPPDVGYEQAQTQLGLDPG
jgi:ribonuclease HI